MGVLVNSPVLVLNQSYEPLNICQARRAIALVLSGKAEMLEDGLGYFRTSRESYPIPSVIKLEYIPRRPRTERKLTRIGVFCRDGYVCQYCGRENQLTIDHVLPRSLGGKHTWENVVAACIPCNRKKAGQTLEEAGMKLRKVPVKPKNSAAFYIPHRYTLHIERWRKYLTQFVTS
jgi:5-methylcytosine-specific restriction endonuclease McrA